METKSTEPSAECEVKESNESTMPEQENVDEKESDSENVG